METKYLRIPFNIITAKKITNGELEGRIVTRDGRSARIVCWDRNSERHYHIVALLDMKVAERIFTYNVEGCEMSGKEGNNDLVLEVSGIIPANYNNISTVNCNEYEIEKCEDIENESIKNDRKDDKVMMELLPWPELEEVGKVYTAGAKNMAPTNGETFQTDIRDIKVPCSGTLPNWKRVMILIRKQDACTRHR